MPWKHVTWAAPPQAHTIFDVSFDQLGYVPDPCLCIEVDYVEDGASVPAVYLV